MYSYSINLEGRVKNFNLPKNRPLVPLYEDIVNSIHAIEERRRNDSTFTTGAIEVNVIREAQGSLLDSMIESFEISDNGIGFTERNMKSFLESDSTHKSEIGGKGVGRFSWLKAFSSVDIMSIYCEDGIFHKRSFTFSLENQFINDVLAEGKTDKPKTIVRLDSYKSNYQKELPKQLNTVAVHVMQHCLVYFLDDNCPQITVSDEKDTIVLNELFKKKVKTSDNIESFTIDKKQFNLLHVKIEDKIFTGNRLYLCANNRLVDSRDLEKQIVDLDGQIFEIGGFWYVGVLTGKYLDDNVDMNRLSFDISKKGTDDISLETIMTESCKRIEKYLSKYLSVITEEKNKHIKEYVTKTAPQYRHLLKYMAEEVSQIKPKLSEEKLDDALYIIKREFNKRAREDQIQLLSGEKETSMSPKEYEKYFQEQSKRISDANSSMLAEYVIHRKVVIDLLSKGLRRKDDGVFNQENYMHNLIYPMRTTSNEADYETHNLWLIDEKLSYCSFISSDEYFDNDPKQERADILILDNPIALSEGANDGSVFDTIIIFELKRPMRNDYTVSANPITQLYKYLRKIRDGKAKDKFHRPINVNDSTKYYLYAICDHRVSTLQTVIADNEFTETPDRLGYYKFHKTYNAYFEILSYDKIVNDAKKRNRVLFEKLGIE